ncbi:MAG: flagellar motor switch phosphatase FliY, partial [Lachnospiraceae bacterium]|nr:flagellar motor switch phosphatase FliY [Lachnospiraceae bacterium]
MDGMLSQDEINALLSGMDLSSDEISDLSDTVSDTDTSAGDSTGTTDAGLNMAGGEQLLDDVEKDAIGEVANISMGSSATTLYSLVNRKVNITTPVVELAEWESILQNYEKPCVFIQIKYTKGLDGTNIMVLKEHDVKVITDLMMGGDGTNTEGEFGELHLSAISEAMNQMMGSAATSLSTMLQTMIDISPPDSSLIDLTKYKSGADISPFLAGTFVKISFRMQIEDLVDSTIMQLYPIEFAKKIVDTFVNNQLGGAASSEPEPEPEAVDNSMNMGGTAPMDMDGGMNMGMQGADMSGMNMGMPAAGMQPQMGMAPQMNMQPQMG